MAPWSSGLTLLLLGAACAPSPAVHAHPVPSGQYVMDYQSGTSGVDSARLTVQTAALEAKLSVNDGVESTLVLAQTPRSEWLSDCFTMNSHAVDEVYRVSPDPLPVGGALLSHPILTTKCGGRLLLGTSAEGGLADPTLGFVPGS